MQCDICHCGRRPEDLYEVKVYNCTFWLCWDCKEELKEGRVRP